MFATGVATAGYLALTSRAFGLFMSALLGRPLWKQFDPIEILFACEAELKNRTGPDDEGETLQAQVSQGQ